MVGGLSTSRQKTSRSYIQLRRYVELMTDFEHGFRFLLDIRTLSRLMFHDVPSTCERVSVGCLICSGEDVGLLKWKEIPPSLLIGRDEPLDGAINQQRVDLGTHSLDTIDDEWISAVMIHLDQSNSFYLKFWKCVS